MKSLKSPISSRTESSKICCMGKQQVRLTVRVKQKRQTAAARQKHMHDVQYTYAKQLQLFYLTARKEPDGPTDLFIPSLTTNALNLVQLKQCRETITLPDGQKPASIVLAICDGSSTVKSLKYVCSSSVSTRGSFGGVRAGFSDVNSSSKLDTSSAERCVKRIDPCD
uniref:tRNA-splicing endonuclease subunit Sen15 domain-containing protein n=1 Tax=Anopheles melas TaxID=34690 RepID=A0A182TMI1_9DIPT